MNIQELLLKATYGVLAVIFIGLLVASIIVRHTAIMIGKPLVFLTELFAMSVLTALPIYAFIATRKLKTKTAHQFFLVFVIKLALLHVLLEVSGFYDYMFKSS